MGRNKFFKIFFLSVFILLFQHNCQIPVFPDFFYGDDAVFYKKENKEPAKDEFIISAKYVAGTATKQNVIIVKHGVTFSPINVYK